MATCKIIQANGQTIAANPNDVQSTVVDPMELIMGFLLQAAIKTPINILKGVAESSEPNIMITSTIFKVARSFAPRLSSVLIPATSLPLGLLPSPITCPLPFVNPVLAGIYFATLAWYDDKPLDESINNAASHLEKIIVSSANDIMCKDTINQDLFYSNGKTPIDVGNYDIKKDRLATTITLPKIPLAQESFGAGIARNAFNNFPAMTTNQSSLPPASNEVVQKILTFVNSTPYSYTAERNGRNVRINTTIGARFTDKGALKQLIRDQVMKVQIDNNTAIITDQSANYQDAVSASINEAKKRLSEND